MDSYIRKNPKETSLEVDSSVPLTLHDAGDLELICSVKKCKIQFQILLDWRNQSWIFFKEMHPLCFEATSFDIHLWDVQLYPHKRKQLTYNYKYSVPCFFFFLSVFFTVLLFFMASCLLKRSFAALGISCSLCLSFFSTGLLLKIILV